MRYYDVGRGLYDLLVNLKASLDATPGDREQIAKIFYGVVGKTEKYPNVSIYPQPTSFNVLTDITRKNGIVNIPFTIKVAVENNVLQDPTAGASIGENYYDNQLRLLSDRIVRELLGTPLVDSCDLVDISMTPINNDFDVPTLVFEITATYQQTFTIS